MVGEVVRAHGVHGAVRVRATGDTLAGLGVGADVRCSDGGDSRTLRIAAPLRSDIIRFEGIDDRDAAALLAGRVLEVPADRLPALDAHDTFYVRDLMGCRVVADGRELGVVQDVLERPANDVLEVAGADGVARLVPFTHDAVIGIDLDARSIELRDGLVGDEP